MATAEVGGDSEPGVCMRVCVWCVCMYVCVVSAPNSHTHTKTPVLMIVGVTLYNDRSGALSPVEPRPLDNYVSVGILLPGQPTVVREALHVRQHCGLVLGGPRYRADLLEELPEGLNENVIL